jgi:hypothetical protein
LPVCRRSPQVTRPKAAVHDHQPRDRPPRALQDPRAGARSRRRLPRHRRLARSTPALSIASSRRRRVDRCTTPGQRPCTTTSSPDRPPRARAAQVSVEGGFGEAASIVSWAWVARSAAARARRLMPLPTAAYPPIGSGLIRIRACSITTTLPVWRSSARSPRLSSRSAS